jgi:TPR repeat protein
MRKTDEEKVGEVMKRVEANDAASICTLAGYYLHGRRGVEQDQTKAMELFNRAAELQYSNAHFQLGNIYYEGGNLKKAKFHFEAAAMAGCEVARYNIGCMEAQSESIERAIKHLTIGASAGEYQAMHCLKMEFEQGFVSRESIDSTLAAYNISCAKMRSEDRDGYIRAMSETN